MSIQVCTDPGLFSADHRRYRDDCTGAARVVVAGRSGALARLSRRHWPAGGPVRDLLEYLDHLHREAGQPSLSDVGRQVALARSTLSDFFNGRRLISQGNLELVVECLEGDTGHAEQLRRRAVTAWREPAAEPQAVPVPPAPATIGHARPDVLRFDQPDNRLNRPKRLFGRDDLIQELGRELDRGARILLHGMGGAGKTAVAASIADQRVAAGQPYLWLRTDRADDEAVIDALIPLVATASDRAAIGATSGGARARAICAAVERSGVRLVVFDDVVDPAGLLRMLDLVPATVGVLVTSRRKFPLDVVREIAGLPPTDACRLLAEHAADDAYAWQPDAEQLCRMLGYHPYAVEIAGCQLRQYGARPAELVERFGSTPAEMPVPGEFARTGRESVKALLDDACEGLAGGEGVAVLSAFGAFGTGVATAEILAHVSDLPLDRVRDGLRALIDVSLAKRRTGSPGYELHDLTYSYARARWAAGGTGGAAVLGAVRTYLKAHVRDYDLLEVDLSNLLELAGAARREDPPSFVGIVEALATGGYLDDRGHPLGLLRLLDDAIDAVRTEVGADGDRLHMLVTKRGNALFNRGERESALSAYREALRLAPTATREAILRGVLGKVLAELGRSEESAAEFAAAYPISAALNDSHLTLRLLEQHSVAAFRLGDYPLVRTLCERGVRLSRDLGTPSTEAIMLNNLGTAEFHLGVQAAVQRHTEALRIATALGDHDTVALAHRTLGADFHALEQREQAADHFGEALRMYEKLGQIERESALRLMMRSFGYLH